MEHLKIEIPEGYKIDLENSDLENNKIVLKKIETVKNYHELAKNLFKNTFFYTDDEGKIKEAKIAYRDTECFELHVSKLNNCFTRKQAKRMLLFNKLQNVITFLETDINNKMTSFDIQIQEVDVFCLMDKNGKYETITKEEWKRYFGFDEMPISSKKYFSMQILIPREALEYFTEEEKKILFSKTRML